ncbi:MAG TPA: CRTAC1 family protein [Myxococcota bacterium]
MARASARWLLAAALSACPLGASGAPELPVFTDVTRQAGIAFRHSYGDLELDNIVEGTGTGACLFDYDDDGLLDIYLVNGAWTRGVSDNRARHLRGKLHNHLYRNQGDGSFSDVTQQTGTGDDRFGTGCSAADYDNDGDVDLYVLNYGRNVLYRNDGSAGFSDVTEQAGLTVPRWSVHAVWLDINGDGWLDVYVANYLEYDDGRFREFFAAQAYPGPLSYGGEPDALFLNNGDGTFSEITERAGVLQPDGRAMSVTAADFDNDGALSIYVTNDAMGNYHFERREDLHFAETAREWGMAYGENGQNVSSMGAAVGDIDRNGRLDVFIPDMNYCTLLLQGEYGFEHAIERARLSVALGQYTGWGPVFFDYDNDGWLDLFTSHGNAHHEYGEEDTLARNNGNGTFEDVSPKSGPFFREKHVGRGVAHGDYDNDGDVDLLVVNLNDAPNLLRNDGGNRKHWLGVDARLKFPKGTRHAIGARVTVTTGELRQIEDVQPVRGYLGQADPRLHFGLGDATRVDAVEIRWPDGVVEKLENVEADRVLRLTHELQPPGKRP